MSDAMRDDARQMLEIRPRLAQDIRDALAGESAGERVTLTYGALCAGYGGLEMGVQAAIPGDLAWYAENDPAPASVMAAHHPGVPNLGDMTRIDWSSVEPVDVITGGFPCQDISTAGKRAGIHHGARSSLFSTIVSAVADLRPRLVVLENVRGLLSGRDVLDAPIDSCLCGWTYRWGGLHSDPEEQGAHLPPSGHGRHDREGPGGPAVDATTLRRGAEVCATCDGEVGRGLCLDCGRGLGHRVVDGRPAAPDPQGRAGSDSSTCGGDPRVIAPSMGSPSGWPAPLDHRSAEAMRNAQAEDARTERERPHVLDPFTGRSAAVCPSCGRRVAGDSSRSVERSWMGTVCRQLALVGYDTWWRGLRAADVGAPHGRFRIFLFATPADAERGGWDGRAPDPLGSALGGVTAAGSGEGAGAGLTLLSTSLLPTPRSSDSNGAGAHGEGGPDLRTAVTLLPTPAVNDMRLLPSPRATDGTKGGPNQRGSSGDLMLPSAVQPTRWGQYVPAIARWETVVGRPAPEPTEPGRSGPRLSPLLVEWMMGLPEGHVTGRGLSRPKELQVLGNGVVPQQAEAATRAWLAVAS